MTKHPQGLGISAALQIRWAGAPGSKSPASASRHRAAGGGKASFLPVSVSAQMIEAGLLVLEASGRLEEGLSSGDALLCGRIYQAMTHVAQCDGLPSIASFLRSGQRAKRIGQKWP